jgi:sirohydrochlorin cobaltochelatase
VRGGFFPAESPDSPRTPRELLRCCLESGRLRIGEILLGSDFTLRHAADDGLHGLEVHRDPVVARSIAREDAEGNYRSLKSAPGLKRGWLLEAGSLEGMEQALEFFYPAALGLLLAWLRGTLAPTPLRETLDRQTGMYRVTQLLRDDQALDLIAGRCGAGCLRTVLWDLSPENAVTSLPTSRTTLDDFPPDTIPLLCREACNLLVAAARPIAKGNLPKAD